MCENKLRHYTKAREILREYRERGAGKLTPDEIEQLDALDDTLSKLITNVQIDVNESGVTLVMDDRQVGTAPFDKPLSVDVGKRIFRFEKPGFKPVTIEQTMVGGSSMTITVKLEKEIHEGKLIVDAGAKDTIILDGKTRGLGHFEGVLASGGYTCTRFFATSTPIPPFEMVHHHRQPFEYASRNANRPLEPPMASRTAPRQRSDYLRVGSRQSASAQKEACGQKATMKHPHAKIPAPQRQNPLWRHSSPRAARARNRKSPCPGERDARARRGMQHLKIDPPRARDRIGQAQSLHV